jgi:hypothetical protein
MNKRQAGEAFRWQVTAGVRHLHPVAVRAAEYADVSSAGRTNKICFVISHRRLIRYYTGRFKNICQAACVYSGIQTELSLHKEATLRDFSVAQNFQTFD